MIYIDSTERLLLRELIEDDYKDLFALNKDPEVLQHTGDAPFSSLQDAQKFLAQYSDYDDHGFGRWAVIRKEDQAFLGWCGLKYNEENQVDLGFRFFKEYWGNGYATEAAKCALEIGFEVLNLTEIIGRSAKENAASIRVLEKIGMSFERTGSCHGIEDAMYYVARTNRDAEN
jgi:[ribosomal protein S5]-alanine N-acetyltransferase